MCRRIYNRGKKLKADVLKCFPQLTEEHLQTLLPSKASVSAVKLLTHSSTYANVFCVQNESDPAPVPLFFEVEKAHYPTVFLLWKHPSLLYHFTVWDPVIDFLRKGADLMLAGVVNHKESDFGQNLQLGQPVAVNTNSNRAAIAVGKAARSSQDMRQFPSQGKGVFILHVEGDHLWFGPGARPTAPSLGPPTDEKEGENDEIEVPDEIKAEENGAEVNIEDPVEETENLNVLEEKLEETKISDEDAQAGPEFMDELLRYCFLKSWKNSAKKTPLPLLTSNFFRVHMIPACPSRYTLDVKKSSYKKLGAFLKAMTQEGLVTIKEQVKGVESIVEVNLEHEALKKFHLREDDFEEPKVEEKKEKESPHIQELYKITANVAPIFKNCNCKKGDMLTAQTVRNNVTEYVKQNNLQNPDNPRFVTLNATLHDALLGAAGGSDTVNITWEEVMQKCLSRMTQTYHLTATGPLTQPKPVKLEPIDMRVSTRSGNKKVTLINNLELFGIDIQDFARKCQHGVAASTSISEVPGKKSRELLVQGNQVDFVAKLLQEEYKIPLRYLRGLEAAAAKKKKNKK
ncbi:eukaryotic translation initiation factor 2D isoform X2 [Neocloeon triangulifer]|uniref:eukaryotic translation initiation factor 2D isoform X2 n=1 Tax=Neocloeon triangulifer TaxID=2078957 RepID=UPI00286ED70F|nr:eukaryotic translation initiation factor 2D isoform X2 [Neocloeon triangulifer]